MVAKITSGNVSRKILMAAGVALVMMSASACSNANTDTSDTSSTSPVASPVQANGKDVLLGGNSVTSDGLPVKNSTPVNDVKGEYLQTTLADNDPAYDFPASVVDPTATDLFTNEEIKSAQNFIAKFTAEEAIDSTLNGNPESVDATEKWLSDNKHVFSPISYDSIREQVLRMDTETPLVFRPFARNGYGTVYGVDKTRISQRHIETSLICGGEVQNQPKPGLSITNSVAFATKVIAQGKEVDEYTYGSVTYIVVPGDTQGEWLIAGFNAKHYFTPVV